MSERSESVWETVDAPSSDEKKYIPSEDELKQNEKKQRAFWDALCVERKESTFRDNHFLNVADNMQSIFQSDHIDTVRCDILNITQDKMKSRVLLLSIREFYVKWNENRYNEEKKREGGESSKLSPPITKCVWAIFRNYINELKGVRHTNADVVKENKNKALSEARKEASRKRAVKEREEMLRLGNGDLNLGAQRFSERMKKEQKISREKDSSNVPLVLQKKFEKWWNSPLSSQFRSPKTDMSVISFRRNSHNSSRKLTVYRKCNESILQTLLYFTSHSNAKDLHVRLTQSWDAVANPYSVPMSVMYWGEHGILSLTGQDRLVSPHCFEVLGIQEIQGKFYIVSEKQVSAYMLFPESEGYHKFEHLNPKVMSQSNILYAVQGNIDYISITSECGELVIQKRERGMNMRSPPVPLPEELSHLFPTTIECYPSCPVARYVENNVARFEVEKYIR